jgi:hypothetical protein
MKFHSLQTYIIEILKFHFERDMAAMQVVSSDSAIFAQDSCLLQT